MSGYRLRQVPICKFLQSALRTSKISNGILPYCENSSEGGYYWRWWCALAICASVLRNANISTSRKPIIRTIFVEHTCQRILQRRSAFCLIMTNLKIKSKTWNYQRKEWFIKGNLKFTGTFFVNAHCRRNGDGKGSAVQLVPGVNRISRHFDPSPG